MTERMCDTKRFRWLIIYFDHRAVAIVHCSNPASDNGSETGQFMEGFQVAVVEPIETFD